MATPGNLEFADACSAMLIEGSYDRTAALKVVDDVAARTNRFVLLNELNDPDDLSSYARFVRSMQLLNRNKGRVTVEKMKQFSMDHENGPGINSVCRHGKYWQETSLSSAIMEIRVPDPSVSRMHVALGKPCHAWTGGGSLTVEIGSAQEEIPERFLTGQTWKTFYKEEPYSYSDS